MLNYFYFSNTPFRDKFVSAERLNYELNDAPEMGLPTPEDPSVKKSQLVIRKENERLGKLVSEKPSYMYLIETISSLIRCVSIDFPKNYEPPADKPLTPYVIEDLGFKLTNDNMVLFMPENSFIVSLFAAARKSRAAVALSQAYVHYSFINHDFAEKLFKVVCNGLNENDYDRVRPFLILF